MIVRLWYKINVNNWFIYYIHVGLNLQVPLSYIRSTTICLLRTCINWHGNTHKPTHVFLASRGTFSFNVITPLAKTGNVRIVRSLRLINFICTSAALIAELMINNDYACVQFWLSYSISITWSRIACGSAAGQYGYTYTSCAGPLVYRKTTHSGKGVV